MNTGRTLRVGARAGVTTLSPQPSTIYHQGGLSLVEILVTVALLVVIILGLTAMFNQTRKAFTIGLGNVDYQDAGRTAMDLITRELEQMSPSGYSTYPFTVPPAGNYANAINFYSDISPTFNTNVPWTMTSGDVTNFSMERLFFVTRYNQQWNAIGYRLIASDASGGVGTLYRYASNNISFPSLLDNGSTFNNFLSDPALPQINANLSRVVDGVVDFRIRAYDTNGLLIPTVFTNFNGGFIGNATNLTSGIVPAPPVNSSINTNIGYYRQSTGDYDYVFCNTAVPAYVEVELGILESPTLARLQALTNTPAYASFLTSHAGQVHIFRQRVTIPAVDATAYPQ